MSRIFPLVVSWIAMAQVGQDARTIRFEAPEAILVLNGGMPPACAGELQQIEMEGSFELIVEEQTFRSLTGSIVNLRLTGKGAAVHTVAGSGRYTVAAAYNAFLDEPPPGDDCVELLLDIDDQKGVRLFNDECLLRDEAFPTVLLRGSQAGHPLRSCITLIGSRARSARDSDVVLFRRGDVDGDGRLDISDAMALLDFLFRGGLRPTCENAADTEDDGDLQATDVVLLLDYLFRGTGFLPPHSVLCGLDVLGDGLTCSSYEACSGRE